MSSKFRILVVEDDPHISQLLETSLKAEGYEVDCQNLLSRANQSVLSRPPDLVLSDLTLPDGDGIDWIQWVRERNQTPILVLSARLDEAEKVKALNFGADDYVSKPFGIQEMLARVRATLRRLSGKTDDEQCVEFGDVVVNLESGTITREGNVIKLTAKELEVLMVLARAPGKLIRHRELLLTVWGPEYVDDTHYLRILMSKLRIKLEKIPSAPKHLLTEPGIGYRLHCS
jgi:two-component system KDP operon response regulator KdpE